MLQDLKENNNIASFILGSLLALSIIFGSIYVSNSLLEAKTLNRYITVKGLVEKNVTSDLALWTIGIKIVGPTLKETNDKVKNDIKIVREFLISKGFDLLEIDIGQYIVEDSFSLNTETNSKKDPNARYVIYSNLEITSKKVNHVKEVSMELSSLINQDILINENKILYKFTKFNELKLDMLKEASINAEKAAEVLLSEKYKLNGLRKSYQGNFTIRSPYSSYDDEYASDLRIDKKVRVVITNEYFIK